MGTGTRPGGRSARVRAAVFAATLAELSEHGYPELSVERIAHRAQVNKTTIYRRWSDLDGLLAEILRDTGQTLVPIPDTGRLDQDLRDLVRDVATAVTTPAISALLRGLAAAAARNPRSATVLSEFLAARQQVASVIVDRAMARGELKPGTDRAALLKSLVAPVFLHLLVTGEPIDDVVVTRAAAATHAAARAGVFG